MVKPDSWIIKMSQEKGMIEPFEASQVRDGKISFGVSCYGYDMRVADEFKMPVATTVTDPKNHASADFREVKADSGYIDIPAHSYVLGRSVEYFRIPRDILTICFGKSTYARCGVIVNVTPFEPEWEGYVTMSISNTSPVPVRVYANEGIAQVLFLEASEVCTVSYADKKGKYQAQKTITHAKI
jgi:dCTP deaminase